MAGNAEISWPHLRMRIEDNASFAHGFRILRYTGTPYLPSGLKALVQIWSNRADMPGNATVDM